MSAKTEFSGCPSAAFVNSSGQILLAGYLKNGLTNLDEPYSGYTLIPTDDMIRFWRSKVKVTTGCRGGGDVALAP